MKAQTSCKDCIFAVKREEEQVGCELYRSEKLGIYDTEDGDYLLERFCNTYRPEEWLSELSLDEYKKRHQVALKEVVPRIGFLVLLDTSKDTPEKLVAMDNLRKTISDIKNQTLHQARYIIVATDKTEYNEEIQNLSYHHTLYQSYDCKNLPGIDYPSRICHVRTQTQTVLTELVHNVY